MGGEEHARMRRRIGERGNADGRQEATNSQRVLSSGDHFAVGNQEKTGAIFIL